MKKKGFVLLEVFIAIAILALTLIPILSYPYRVYKREKGLYMQMEMERVKDLALARLYENLQKIIDFDTISLVQDEIVLEKIPLHVSKKESYLIEPRFHFSLEREEKVGLLTAQLTLETQSSKLPVQKEEFKLVVEKSLEKKI